MKFLIVFGFVLHLLFLVSIFYIYFRSPILTDLAPQNELKNAPAKRLVVFVADGLRAESLYESHLNRTPFLAQIILNHGISGISHTRVPVSDVLIDLEQFFIFFAFFLVDRVTPWTYRTFRRFV